MQKTLKKKKIKIDGVDIFANLFAVFVLAIILYPLLNVVSVALSSSAYIVKGEVAFWPKGITLDSFEAILKNPKVVRSYFNSFIYTGTAVVISLFMCSITAYPLSRKKLPGRNGFIMMILFPMFFSGGIIPYYILMQNLGLMDNIWALVIPWAVPSYELFLLKNYFENVPTEIYEAASIDGSSEYRTLFTIFMPLSKPILATLTIFIALGQWNNYMVPLMYISSPSKYPLVLVLQEMLMEEQAKSTTTSIELASLTSQGMKNATIVLSAIPLLILYPFVQKYFIGSIYAGSIKG